MLLEIVPFFHTLLTLSLKASILILVILLVRALFGRHLSPAWRHAIWGLVPLQLLLCFSIPSFLSVYNFVPQEQETKAGKERSALTEGEVSPFQRDLAPLNTLESPQETTTVAFLEDNEQNALPEDEISLPTVDDAIEFVETSKFVDIPEFVNTFEPPTEPLPVELPQPAIPERVREQVDVRAIPQVTAEYRLHVRLFEVGTFVWLSGCILMSLVFLRQTLLCRRWMRTAEHVESEAVLHLFKECASRMKVRTWLVIAESRNVSGPLLIGAIRPMLLLPYRLVESATPNQLQTVFLHELAHLKRWDVWTGWMMTFFLTLHWFNPLLWLAVRKMNADREEACDALALQTLNPAEHSQYGYALIDIAQNFVTPARTPGLVGISETGKHLKRRIEMIKQTGTWKLRWKILAVFAVLFISVATMTDAQDRSPKKSLDELQAEIDRLQAELTKLKEAENEAKLELTLKVYPLRETDPMTALSVCQTLLSDSSGVKLSAEVPTRRLIVLGSEADHKKVKDVLKQLEETTETKNEDDLPEGIRVATYSTIGDYNVSLADADTILKDCRSLLNDSPNAEVSYNAEWYNLRVTGSEADHKKIETYLEQLRQKPAYGVYSLRDVFGYPDAAEPFLQSVLAESPDAKIAVDKSRNIFIVVGNKPVQDKIEAEISRNPIRAPKLFINSNELLKELFTGDYHGTKDDKKIDVAIHRVASQAPLSNRIDEYRIAFTEDGLPKPEDTEIDALSGSVVFNSNKSGKIWLTISMEIERPEGGYQYYDLTAAIDIKEEPDGFVFSITIPKSKDWDETRVSKKIPFLIPPKKAPADLGQVQQSPPKKNFPVISAPDLLGSYLGTEGDGWFGIEIGKEWTDAMNTPSCPITLYENGLPGNGYNPNDDNKYLGEAYFYFDSENKKRVMGFRLVKKFDGTKEEKFDKWVKAQIETKNENNGTTTTITIPKSEEWDEIHVSKFTTPAVQEPEKQAPPQKPMAGNAPADLGKVPNLVGLISPSVVERILPGRYSGKADDERIGIEIGQPTDDTYPVTLYVNGLPGQGFDPQNGTKLVGKGTYSSTGVFASTNYRASVENRLQIDFTERFEGSQEEHLKDVSSTAEIEWKNGNDRSTVEITIPDRSEWGKIHVSKEMPLALDFSDIDALVPGSPFLPKNYPIFELRGEYSGQDGNNKPVGFRFAPKLIEKGESDFDKLDGKEFIFGGNGGTFKISDSLLLAYIYEGRAKSKNRVEPETYIGTLQYTGPDELELRTEEYYDKDKEEQPVPEMMKVMPVKLNREGPNIVFEIPKGGMRVTKITPIAPAWVNVPPATQTTVLSAPVPVESDRQQETQTQTRSVDASHVKPIPGRAMPGVVAKNLPGSYLGTKGNDRFGIEIGPPQRNGNVITFYENGLPGNGYDPQKDGKYIGGLRQRGNDGLHQRGNDELHVVLIKKFNGAEEEKIEESLGKITGELEWILKDDASTLEITFPKNEKWDEIHVSKEMPPVLYFDTYDVFPPQSPFWPKNTSFMQLRGDYSGQDGTKPVCFRFAPEFVEKGQPDFDRLSGKPFIAGNGDTCKISDWLAAYIYEGRNKPASRNGTIEPETYAGTLRETGPDEMVLSIENYYDNNMEKESAPDAMKAIPVKVALRQGDHITLEIPKGGTRVTKIVKRLPGWADTRHLAEITDPVAKNLPGEYTSIEGDDRFSVRIGEPRTRGESSSYAIGFHEKNGNRQYLGSAWYHFNPDNEARELLIQVEKEYDGTNKGVFIEGAARIRAQIDVKGENVEITIPKAVHWNEFRVTKEEQ